MFKQLTLGVLAALAIVPQLASAQNNEFYDPSLIAELVSSNPGKEIAMPYVKAKDPSGDGVADSFDVSFNVYKAGTTTKLFTTPVRSFKAPMPCAQPLYTSNYIWPSGLLLKNGRLYISVNVTGNCQDQSDGMWKSANIIGLYGTDAGKSSDSTTWAVATKGQSADSISSVDYDGDGVEEVALVIWLAATDKVGEKIRVLFLDPSSGKIEADSSYLRNNFPSVP